MSSHLWHVAVLIPARNEEVLLPRCLDSVIAACEALPASVTYDIVVVADSCRDSTFRIAQRKLLHRGIAVRAEVGVVGASRALAAEIALKRSPMLSRECWLANTDADCVVPTTWLIDQLTLADAGFEAVTGTVNVDNFDEHDSCVAERFRTSYVIHSDGTHPHVHGANIGVRADAYLRSGGWNALVTAEDHDLWGRLRRFGARTISASKLCVTTSGRRNGRAPSGFAEALAAHNPTAAEATV